jgi:thiamine-phosphate pyrophosphorylase
MRLNRRLRIMGLATATETEDRIRAWAAGGVTALQLRDKHCTDEAFLAAGKRLFPLCRELGLLFMINDRWFLAADIPCEGVHVGQQDDFQVVRTRLRPGMILGVSAATVEQALAAVRAGADYLGVGPVYATASKTEEKPVGLSRVAAIRQAVPGLPLVAIGGITPDRVREVLQAGADGVAVIGWLQQADPRAAATALAKPGQERNQ